MLLFMGVAILTVAILAAIYCCLDIADISINLL